MRCSSVSKVLKKSSDGLSPLKSSLRMYFVELKTLEEAHVLYADVDDIHGSLARAALDVTAHSPTSGYTRIFEAVDAQAIAKVVPLAA
jgi:hypothetical protein